MRRDTIKSLFVVSLGIAILMPDAGAHVEMPQSKLCIENICLGMPLSKVPPSKISAASILGESSDEVLKRRHGPGKPGDILALAQRKTPICEEKSLTFKFNHEGREVNAIAKPFAGRPLGDQYLVVSLEQNFSLPLSVADIEAIKAKVPVEWGLGQAPLGDSNWTPLAGRAARPTDSEDPYGFSLYAKHPRVVLTLDQTLSRTLGAYLVGTRESSRLTSADELLNQPACKGRQSLQP